MKKTFGVQFYYHSQSQPQLNLLLNLTSVGNDKVIGWNRPTCPPTPTSGQVNKQTKNQSNSKNTTQINLIAYILD